MNNISCEICMDLIPLVQDGVASADTQQAVAAHAAHCPTCKAMLTQEPVPPQMDDRRVLGALRKQLVIGALILVVVGAFLGVGLTGTQAVFYNLLIMPAIGALAYLALGKKAILAPVALFCISFFGPILGLRASGQWYEGAAVSALFWALIYCGLCVLGIVIAALFHFAFRKDGISHEK